MHQSERMLDILRFWEEGPRICPVPPSPHPLPNPLVPGGTPSVAGSWGGHGMVGQGPGTTVPIYFLVWNYFNILITTVTIPLNVSPGQCVYTLNFEYMDRKPSSKIILLIAEFMKTLKQLHKHSTKTHKNQRMQVEKSFHLR